jgi:hypothetical protein
MRRLLPVLLLAASLLPPTVPALARDDLPSGPTAVLTRTRAQPFEYLTIATTDWNEALDTVVLFRFGATEIPVVPSLVSDGLVRVAVPPLVKKAKFAGGLAKVYLAQPDAGADAACYAGKLKVGKLPRSRLPAGTITALFLGVQRDLVAERRTALPASGHPGDNPGNLAYADEVVEAVDGILAAAPGGEGATLVAHAKDIQDFDVAYTKTTFQQMDGLYLGMLQAGAVNTDDPVLQITMGDLFEQATAPSVVDPDAQLDLAAALRQLQTAGDLDRTLRIYNAINAPLNALGGTAAMLAAGLALIPGTQGVAAASAIGAAWLIGASSVVTLTTLWILQHRADERRAQGDITAYNAYMDSAQAIATGFVKDKYFDVVFGFLGSFRRLKPGVDFVDGLLDFKEGAEAQGRGLAAPPGVSRLAAGFPSKLKPGLYSFTIGDQTLTLPIGKGFDFNLFAGLLEQSIVANCTCFPATGVPFVQVNSTPFDGTGFTISATCTCVFPDGQTATDTQTIRISKL